MIISYNKCTTVAWLQLAYYINAVSSMTVEIIHINSILPLLDSRGAITSL